MSVKTNLTYAYRILAKLGLDDHTYTHLSARPKGTDYYYIYPFGFRFEEVTKDTLLKVDFDGNIIEGNEYQYNKTGYVIHGSIYKERKDLNAIFHLHTVATVAVSAMRQGLTPISQWALHFYNKLAYHKYNALALDKFEHGDALTNDLGDKSVMFMENHGIITCGKTIHEAMFYCYHLQRACEVQCAALASGAKLIIPSETICNQANQDIMAFEKDLGKRDWDAWVRMIDRDKM